MPRLLIRGGTANESEVRFRRRFLLLGRHARCAVRMRHHEVSMRHALAVQFAEGVFLLDLNSRTGTHWDDGHRHSGWLSADHQVRIGRFSIRVAGGFDPDAPEPPDPTVQFLGAVDRIPEVELAFIDGPLEGTEYRLKRAITLIGRGPGCHIRLRDDADISSIHACLLLDERGLYLIDTLSRRGTQVDGEPHRCAALDEGRHVTVGRHRIRVARCRLRSRSIGRAGRANDGTCPDAPEYRLVKSLYELRAAGALERGRLADELLAAGQISPWQSRKIRSKDPIRLILDGRFLLAQPVGRGGMGTVYRAFDLDAGDVVAVKMPETRFGNRQRRFARFQREIQISSGLHHPHIVRVRDVGQRQQFLVFDFVNGRPLSRLIADGGAQDPVLVVRWMSQVADALAYAREQGVIHRDIKPDNIMITEHGSAMLLDLGLACLTQDARQSTDIDAVALTQLGFTVGTIDYISPEQAAGSADVDARSDIYSLGCTMYAALSGQPPFHSRISVEVARRHLQEPPSPIPDVDPELEVIVGRAMQKCPEDRFQTPEEMRDALDQWLRLPVAAC